MSAATASSTEIATVHVRLLDEEVDVWRPVHAERLSGVTYRLSAAPTPEDEVWSFQPGDIVVAERRAGGPDGLLIAVARVGEFDERSREDVRRSG